MASPDEDDVERVERDYVDPESTSRDDVAQDLIDEGFPDGAVEAFDERIVSAEDVDVPDDRLTTREDVADAVDRAATEYDPDPGRRESVTSDVAREAAAPPESELTRARGQAAQLVDDEGSIRSNPDLDPLGGDEGREIGPVSEVTSDTGGRGGGYTEGVERTGENTGTYYYESPDGDRYPIAEVDLS